MKKIFVLLIILLCGCTSVRNTNNTITPLTKKFNYTEGVCLKDNTIIKYSSYNRGDVVSIVDEDDTYYYIDNNGMKLFIKKEFIRTEKEEPFNEYQAYTRNGSKLYSNIDFKEEIYSFSLNNNVTVIDEFAGVLLVQYDNNLGFMDAGQVSKTLIQIYIAPKEEYKEPEASSSSGGGSSDSTPSSDPTPTPTPEANQQTIGDGEDISIAIIPKYENHFLAYASVIKGMVLMDGTPSYITTINRNDDVYVLSEDEDEYTILLNGFKGKIEKKYVRQASDNPYESFEGYTVSGATVYSDFEMKNKSMVYGINEIIKVIDEVDDVYVVEIKDKIFGYMKKSSISKDKIYIAPKVVAPEVEESTDNSSNSGGSTDSSPSSEPTPAPAPVQAEEWTPEAL